MQISWKKIDIIFSLPTIDKVKNHRVSHSTAMEPERMLLTHGNVLEQCFLSHGHAEFFMTKETEQKVGVCLEIILQKCNLHVLC